MNWPFSKRLRSKSILTWASSNFPVLITKFNLCFYELFLMLLRSSVAKVMMHLIGVINSWDTLEVNRWSRLFFCSALSRFCCAEISRIVKIKHSISLNRFWLWVKLTTRFSSVEICFIFKTISCDVPNSSGFKSRSSSEEIFFSLSLLSEPSEPPELRLSVPSSKLASGFPSRNRGTFKVFIGISKDLLFGNAWKPSIWATDKLHIWISIGSFFTCDGVFVLSAALRL